MGIQTLITLAGIVLAAIAGAFGIGHARGTSTERAASVRRRYEEMADAQVAAAKTKMEKTQEASDVQQDVNHMPDGDVDSELREQWTRKG